MTHYVFCLDLAKLNRADGIITIRTEKYTKKGMCQKTFPTFLPREKADGFSARSLSLPLIFLICYNTAICTDSCIRTSTGDAIRLPYPH